MAITKIHAIKSTLGKALAYIENPDKTDGQMLVSGYNCEPQTASIDFEMTAVLAHKARNLKRKRSTNLAYHLIQSFSPEDAVTPEQAHELGKKLAFEYTGGKYEYVVATHIDKGHIHNHIMLNAVSFYDYAMMTSFNGTGPYVMDTYVEDYSLSFTRNEDYWQEHDWGPDTVTFLYTSDATSMAASVLNGDVDYMVMDAPETMELFEANGWELVPQFANAGNVSFVIPITNVPDDPWSNVKVREAVFSHGIDLVGAAAAIVGEAGYHTDAIGYKEATYYDEGLEFTSLDYELAKKMLAEAGYPDGFKTRIVADATTQTQATVIQAELKKLGIEAEVEMPDMNEMQKFWTGENTAGGLMVGAMYFADPILDRLDKFYGPYGYMAGCTDWTDEEYALYDNIRSAKSIEEQDELIYKFCVQFVQKDFHFLPIANAVGRAAVSDRLILGDMASLGISYWNPNMVGCKN